MENTNKQGDTLQTTECVGVTETPLSKCVVELINRFSPEYVVDLLKDQICFCNNVKAVNHKPHQNKDGSIYCYCPNLPDRKVSCGVNHVDKKIMCSVCGFKMEVKE